MTPTKKKILAITFLLLMGGFAFSQPRSEGETVEDILVPKEFGGGRIRLSFHAPEISFGRISMCIRLNFYQTDPNVADYKFDFGYFANPTLLVPEAYREFIYRCIGLPDNTIIAYYFGCSRIRMELAALNFRAAGLFMVDFSHTYWDYPVNQLYQQGTTGGAVFGLGNLTHEGRMDWVLLVTLRRVMNEPGVTAHYLDVHYDRLRRRDGRPWLRFGAKYWNSITADRSYYEFYALHRRYNAVRGSRARGAFIGYGAGFGAETAASVVTAIFRMYLDTGYRRRPRRDYAEASQRELAKGGQITFRLR